MPTSTVKLSRVKKTPAERAEIARINGRKGGLHKAGRVSIAALQQRLIKEHIDQRLMRATDIAVNAQIALARGISFLYRIDKKQDPKSKRWINQKPVLVEKQWEIEAYLEQLAENNGDIDDDKDESAAYYYITTSKPDGMAIDSMLNRVHGRPKETVDINNNHIFTLAGLADQQKTMINGNADMKILPEKPLDAP